jgi:hypothetical protein
LIASLIIAEMQGLDLSDEVPEPVPMEEAGTAGLKAKL